MLFSYVKISTLLRLHKKSHHLHQNLKGLVFIGVYIINRILHGRLEIRNFSSCVKKYFTCTLRSLVKYCSTLKEKFFLSPHSQHNLQHLRWERSNLFDGANLTFHWSDLTMVRFNPIPSCCSWPFQLMFFLETNIFFCGPSAKLG